MSPRLLIDTIPLRITLHEDAGSPGTKGKLIARGEYSYCDRPTANKRVYSEALLRRELDRLNESIAAKRVFGELDHPEDGRTKLHRVSHIVTKLSIEDGRVIGESQIVPTSRGKDLQALFESGAQIGVSSRGYGSTLTDADGNEEVQEDFRLLTYDFVADPANHTSYPEFSYESKGEKAMANEAKTSPEDLSKTIRAVMTEMMAGFATKEDLANLGAAPKAESASSEKIDESSEWKAKYAEMDAALRALKAENKQLAEAAKLAAYSVHLERKISDNPQAALIRRMVGSVTLFESKDALDAAIQEASAEVSKQMVESAKVDEARAKEKSLVEDDRRRQDDRVAKLESALEKSTKLNNLFAVQLYAERRIGTHPRATEMRQMLESAPPSSKEEVDNLITQFKERAPSAPKLQETRARIKRILGSGQEASALHEETGSESGSSKPNQTSSGSYNGLGVSVSELKKLAGIESAS